MMENNYVQKKLANKPSTKILVGSFHSNNYFFKSVLVGEMRKTKNQILLWSPPKLTSKLQLFSPCPDNAYMFTRKWQC